MVHDEHFLRRLDRVSAEQADLALRLYRDEPLLRTILNTARIPDDVERVAISLGDRQLGPFVVVTRSGKFVTCLGRGMHLGDRLVITRDRLEELAQYIEELRQRIRAARELSPDGAFGTLARRIYDAGDGLSREDMSLLLGIKPFFAPDLLQMMMKDAKSVVDTLVLLRKVKKPRGQQVKQLRATWHLSWAMAHNAVLCSGEEVEGVDPLAAEQGEPELRFAALRGTSLVHLSFAALRGAWCIGTVGKSVLAQCQEGYREAPWGLFYGRSLLALVALAWRHPELRDEVRRTLAEPPRIVNDPNALPAWPWMWKRQCELLPTILDPVRGMEQATNKVRELAGTVLAGLPERSAYLSNAGDDGLPLDIAIGIVLGLAFPTYTINGPLWAFARMMPAIARAEAWELYAPKTLLADLGVGWTEAKGVELLDQAREESSPMEPVRKAPRPKPNEPCSCGSGRKYKRCCGAVGGAA